MNTKILTLQEKINYNLPGVEAHTAFYPLRFIKHNAEDYLNFRKSAVAVHIYPNDEPSNDFSILLIEYLNCFLPSLTIKESEPIKIRVYSFVGLSIAFAQSPLPLISFHSFDSYKYPVLS